MTMTEIEKIERAFQALPDGIQSYFEFFPELINICKKSSKWSAWDPLIAYLFSRVERAQMMSLYCGLVKLHGVDKDLAWNAISHTNITRGNFSDFYEKVFGCALGNIAQKIEHATEVRNKIIHGMERNVNKDERPQAVMEVLEYSKLFNEQLPDTAGFQPFGNLRGFHKGRKIWHTNETSRWILKGMGFDFR